MARHWKALDDLTLKEIELAELTSKGKVRKEIASILGVSGKTIDGHFSRIYMKLGTANPVLIAKMVWDRDHFRANEKQRLRARIRAKKSYYARKGNAGFKRRHVARVTNWKLKRKSTECSKERRARLDRQNELDRMNRKISLAKSSTIE